MTTLRTRLLVSSDRCAGPPAIPPLPSSELAHYRLPAYPSPLGMLARLFLISTSLAMLQLSAAPFIVAHRGASGDAPENTMPAFELAWKQGADAIEGDFHLSKDGEIVCFHDHDTSKLTGQKVVLKESTFAELQRLDVGSWKGSDFAATRIPTLGQVLATVPAGKKIYIEIKCGPEVVPSLLEQLEASKLQDDQIVVISFDAEVIRKVKTKRPEWTANWLYSFDKREQGAVDEMLPQVLATLADIDADGLGSNSHPSLTVDHVTHLRKAGFQHHVWTVNDAETARRFLEMGSKSVTTDYPGALRSQLEDS